MGTCLSRPPTTYCPRTRSFIVLGARSESRAVISPSWSIHSGVGTGAYTFCWGMGGENQAFDDMDHLTIDELR